METERNLPSMYRFLGALGVTLGPLFIFMLPTFLDPHAYETPAAGLAALADTSHAVAYGGFVLQLLGASAASPPGAWRLPSW